MSLLGGGAGAGVVWTLWSVLFAGAAVLCAASLVRHRRGPTAGAAAEANHVVMAVAMAVMAAPGGMALVPAGLGVVVFVVLAAGWLARLVVAGRRGAPLGSPIGSARCTAHPTHLLLVNAAMVAMYLPMLGDGGADHVAAEHAGHGGGDGSLTLPLLSVGLAIYLLVHAAATIAALVSRSRAAATASSTGVPEVPDVPAPGGGVATVIAPAPAPSRLGALTAPRTQLVCQAVMGLGMAAMLLAH